MPSIETARLFIVLIKLFSKSLSFKMMPPNSSERSDILCKVEDK